jgi:hypothetical protein
MKNILPLLGALLALSLSGCATTKAIRNAPPSPYRPTSYLDDPVFAAKKLQYESGTPTTNRTGRDDLLFSGINVINRNYFAYVDYMTQARAGLATGADFTSLGLTTAATLITPAGTKSILSGLSSVVIGSRASYEKNFFQEVSFFVLSAQMDARRREVYSQIVPAADEGKEEEYSVQRIVAALDRYYEAGAANSTLSASVTTAMDRSIKAIAASDAKAAPKESVNSPVPPTKELP